MAESSVNVTEGSGKRLHTYDRTISSVLVQEQAVFPAEYPYASYTVPFASVSAATASAHILQIMAGSSLRVYLRRLHIEQASNATTAGAYSFGLFRLSTAGTGGSSITPEKSDPADAAAGATAQTLPSSKGTEGNALLYTVLTFRQAVLTTGAQIDDAWDWEAHPGTKGIVIAAGTSNGLAIKTISGIASATVSGWVEFVELSY